MIKALVALPIGLYLIIGVIAAVGTFLLGVSTKSEAVSLIISWPVLAITLVVKAFTEAGELADNVLSGDRKFFKQLDKGDKEEDE